MAKDNIKLYLRILLILVVPILFATKGNAQELSIGVPLIEEPLNFFNSNDYFSRFIVSASCQSLLKIENSNESKIKLILADSFSLSQDGKTFELRLRAGATFINSELITQADLQASFTRCSSNVGNDYLIKFKQAPDSKVYEKEKRLLVSVHSESGQDSIFEYLQNCPILEARTVRLFADDLGSSNLIVGSGPYEMVSRVKNREARFERVFKSNAKTSIWAAAITLRSFADSSHALTAIRTGTIDAFFTEDTEIVEKVNNDPTLRIEHCGVYNIILRRGLEISCFPNLDPGSMKYSAL